MSRSPALLFDLDGTLIHSDPVHFTVFRDIFAEYGRSLDWDEFTIEVVGRPNPEIFAHFLPDQAHRSAELSDRKEAEFRNRLGESLEPTPGTVRLLDWAEANGLPFAAVTNAPHANAEAMLKATGLRDRFQLLIAEGDAVRSKPDPAPYLLAMERLGVAPEHSIAFEDSRSGNRAARASGAYVFGLTSNLSPEALLQAGAHQAIADFDDPALWAYLDQRRA